MFYSFLVDRFARHRIFYALSFLYAAGAVFFAFALMNPDIGLLNADASPYRLLGWAYYLYVESFGSLLPVLFWAFAADTSSPDSAKRGFPFIAFVAQFGVWFGCAINAGRFGDFKITTTLVYSSIAMIMIALMVYIFMQVVSADQLKSYSGGTSNEKSKKSAGLSEALKLVLSEPYLMGIFFSIVIYEVINTLFDFKFKALVGETVQRYIIENNISAEDIGAVKTAMFNQWTGSTGEWMAILGIITYIFGLGKLAQKISFTFSLLILPILIAIVAIILGVFSSLMIASFAVIVTKGINYTLYQPLKEQLYIPTSKEAKWKSKTLVDMFGSRGSKASGSAINILKIYTPSVFSMIFLGSSLVLCFVWFLISFYLGKTYEKAVSKNETVC
jgi:AAA family ATP:ADP antiporter